MYIVATAPGQAATSPGVAIYRDPVGDAGEAPDIEQITIRVVRGGLAVDVELARPTELGPYGWILFGVDTDRNPFTGGGRGDELLVYTSGDGTTLTRWEGGQFTPSFAHHDLHAAFTGTDLTFVLSVADTHTRSFEFSASSLRGASADLAPDSGIATYPMPLLRSYRARRRAIRPRKHSAVGGRAEHARRPRSTLSSWAL